MAIVRQIKFNPSDSTKKMHDWAMAGDVVLIKDFLKESLIRDFRKELLQWRNSTPSHDPLDYYPKDVLNLHISVVNKGENTRLDKSIDYHEQFTNFTLYNYRIGDMFNPLIQKMVPSIKSLGPQILSLFNTVLRNSNLIHASKKDHNLYFEIAHFPCGSGYIEEHTHETILNYGQPLNMVMALSKRKVDFEEGGLFVRLGDTVHDLREEFDLGDCVFFRNDIPHWVEPVNGTLPHHSRPENGRWSLTMFYY